MRSAVGPCGRREAWPAIGSRLDQDAPTSVLSSGCKYYEWGLTLEPKPCQPNPARRGQTQQSLATSLAHPLVVLHQFKSSWSCRRSDQIIPGSESRAVIPVRKDEHALSTCLVEGRHYSPHTAEMKHHHRDTDLGVIG